MRTIERTGRFKGVGRHRASLDASLVSVAEALANDHQPLEPRCHDHALSGEWSDHRDCHVKSDLSLIYQKPDHESARLRPRRYRGAVFSAVFYSSLVL